MEGATASSGSKAVEDLLAVVPGVPCEGEAPVFEEPWQAQAFAIALSLQQKGVFTWGEWAESLGDEIRNARAAGDADDGSTYYQYWLRTLERLVAVKGIASADTLDRYAHAWDHAADRTPHGQPIELRAEDFH
jgi:nitrile hydratase accessory protein